MKLFLLFYVSFNYTLLQNGSFLHLCLQFFTSIHSRDRNILVLKTNSLYVGILLPVPSLALLLSAACDSASTYQILYPSWTIGDGVVTSIVTFQDDRTASYIYFRFPVWSRLTLKEVKIICTPMFDKILQPMAKILWLPLSENKPPPYWNFVSGFHIDDSIVIGMWFCIIKFIRIGGSTAELWCHIDLLRRRPLSRKSTSGFRIGDAS